LIDFTDEKEDCEPLGRSVNIKWKMMTYNELIELQEKLANGEIGFEFAKDIFWKDYKEGKKAWYTKDWKERRSNVIKDKCEICGRIETLTLHHLSHPKKYFEYENDITKEYTQLVIDSDTLIDIFEFGEHIIKNYDYIPVPLCPTCGGAALGSLIEGGTQYRNDRNRKGHGAGGSW
jgi:hypothetical protein